MYTRTAKQYSHRGAQAQTQIVLHDLNAVLKLGCIALTADVVTGAEA